MKVTLYAEESDFHITKLSSEEQIVTGRPYAQWDWTVMPIRYGERSLHLKATAHVVLERFGEKSVDVPVIDKLINVRISPGYIAKETLKNASTWQYVLGGGSLMAVVSGLFAAIRRYRTKRKKIIPGFRKPTTTENK